MTYRLHIPLPRRTDHTLLPAVCAGALVVMLVLQLAVPRAVPLPEPGVVRPFTIVASRPTTLVADPAILVHPIFSGGAGVPAAVQGPVDGATAIGVMSRAGSRIAFVQGADGAVASLRPGQTYRGWQLHAIGRAALVFEKGGQSATLPVQPAPGHASSTASPLIPQTDAPMLQPRG